MSVRLRLNCITVLWQSSIRLLDLRCWNQSIWFVLGLVNSNNNCRSFCWTFFTKSRNILKPKHVSQAFWNILSTSNSRTLELPILVELSLPQDPTAAVILRNLRMNDFAYVSAILNFVYTIRSGTEQLLQCIIGEVYREVHLRIYICWKLAVCYLKTTNYCVLVYIRDKWRNHLNYFLWFLLSHCVSIY